MVMKPEEITKSGGGATEQVAGVGGTDVVPNAAAITTAQVEPGVEAKENPKRKPSWMKNIGSGMRTLRLRKHGGSDKKNETVLNSLASASILDPDYEATSTTEPVTSGIRSQHPPPPQIPLPPLPTDSVPLPPSPSPIKTLPKAKKKKSSDSSSSIKNHTSRLSLREHVSKSKGKKGEGATATAGLNGSISVPREGAPTQKSSSSGSGGPTHEAENVDKADPSRFIGEGLSFKAKLIGILEVSGPRGDRICQEALSELKMAVKAAGEHKQKVTIHVALDGLRIRDEKTGDCLYHHQVHKISFIAQDLTDTRAFGYIFGSPDTGHRFFGIKTEKSASQVVMSMRDLFQVVFDLKKKEIERAKQQLEMQQKFLATRAAETATRSSHKSGIAETYIDGACSLGGSPSVNPASAPAEADLLNLEVELTSLQEGLENIHSTLIDTATSHSSFNRGSTASISSDPTNPGSASFNKYNLNSTFGTHQSGNSAGCGVSQMIPSYPNAVHASGGHPQSDPFGDSFDPFDATKALGQNIVSPSFPADPFTNVDPFAGTKFAGGLESTEFLASDPFETPAGGGSFTFPESNGRAINRQISITSNSSDISSGKASIGPDMTISRSVLNSTLASAHSPNLQKAECFSSGITPSTVPSWTASFEETFASTNGEEGGTGGGGGLGDLFTELDPLGTGRVKPFVDRKDFFQDLKNPPKKVLSEISTPPTMTGTKVTHAHLKENSLRPTQSEKSSSPLPNSFSTNFNPVSSTEIVETGGKLPPPNKTDSHLRTSTIRAAQLQGDMPPNYSPPSPPQQQPITSSSSVSPSVYFVSAPPKSQPTPPSAKKSPQLLRNMTIANAASSHVVSVAGQSASPKTLPRSSFRLDKHSHGVVDIISDEIPNLTPPPRPPHTSVTSSSRNPSSIIPTALPRPHSGTPNEGKRQFPSSSSSVLPPMGTGTLPPEPPPRPLATANEPILPPPPLPPKKQTIGPMLSNPLLTKLNYNTSLKSKGAGSAESGSNLNDLPLPLPSRKGNQHTHSNVLSTQPRYAYPAESSPVPSLPHSYGHAASFDETDHHPPTSNSTSNLSRHKLPGLTMEAALSQVASLSLSQLAGKLQIPVDKLSSCTIHDLAIKLTMMNLKQEEASASAANLKTLPHAFESNFADEDGADDFSTVSAPATVFTKETLSTRSTCNNVSRRETQSQPQYDRYAVFRELAESEATSGFSVCESQENLPAEEEEEDGQRSRTLTSRGSSSEKTLQADFDTPGNGLSTMDDITDANFSEGDGEEESGLIDEVVDLNLKAEWATFESHFEEQFVPLAAAFSRSEESPWDSDGDNRKPKFDQTEIVMPEIQLEKENSLKMESQLEQFDFQLFEKPFVSVDPAGRRNSRGMELRVQGAHVEPGQFQRQSSGSSKHSERSLGPPPASSRNVTTTSDYSDSGKEKERSYTAGRGGERRGEERRQPDSRSSRGRRYSREDSDEGSGKKKGHRRYYYEDEEEETGSRSPPVDRRRVSHRKQDDEDYYSNASSRQGHARGTGSSRHPHSAKYYSQSLHRKDREGRYHSSTTGRRPSENEKYSNHESDFDDSYEDERRRGRGRGSGSGYSRSERDRDHRVSSRPASSGGSVSGSGSRHRNPKYRDSSREYYYQHHQRERRHGRDKNYAVPYHHTRHVDNDFENDGRGEREFSEYSGDEGSRGRRIRGRRRVERDRDRPYYYDNSPSWESETPPSGKEGDDGNDESGEVMKRGTRLRRSDLDRPRERDRDVRERERPSSSSYHGDRLDGSSRKVSRYQSDLSLNANKSNTKLSACEFGFEDFSPPSSSQQRSQDQRKLNQLEPSRGPSSSKPSQSETSSNKSDHPNSNASNKLSEHHLHHTQPPPESPFADNFLTQANIFFPADFSRTTPNNLNTDEATEEVTKTIVVNVNLGGNVPTSNRSLNQKGPESNSSGSAEKSDENEENSSPEVIPREERNKVVIPPDRVPHNNQLQQMIQIVRKPIISDTIHEVPDTEMKKSDSFNIFDREKDPFADDEFFN